MLVKVGDFVQAGQRIIEDKKNPGVFITAHQLVELLASVNRGEKRRFISVEIDVNETEIFKVFNKTSTKNEHYRNYFKTLVCGVHLEQGPLIEPTKIGTIQMLSLLMPVIQILYLADPYNIIKEDQNL